MPKSNRRVIPIKIPAVFMDLIFHSLMLLLINATDIISLTNQGFSRKIQQPIITLPTDSMRMSTIRIGKANNGLKNIIYVRLFILEVLRLFPLKQAIARISERKNTDARRERIPIMISSAACETEGA